MNRPWSSIELQKISVGFGPFRSSTVDDSLMSRTLEDKQLGTQLGLWGCCFRTGISPTVQNILTFFKVPNKVAPLFLNNFSVPLCW